MTAMGRKSVIRKLEIVFLTPEGVTEQVRWVVLHPVAVAGWVVSRHDSFEAAIAHVDTVALMRKVEPPC